MLASPAPSTPQSVASSDSGVANTFALQALLNSQTTIKSIPKDSSSRRNSYEKSISPPVSTSKNNQMLESFGANSTVTISAIDPGSSRSDKQDTTSEQDALSLLRGLSSSIDISTPKGVSDVNKVVDEPDMDILQSNSSLTIRKLSEGPEANVDNETSQVSSLTDQVTICKKMSVNSPTNIVEDNPKSVDRPKTPAITNGDGGKSVVNEERATPEDSSNINEQSKSNNNEIEPISKPTVDRQAEPNPSVAEELNEIIESIVNDDDNLSKDVNTVSNPGSKISTQLSNSFDENDPMSEFYDDLCADDRHNSSDEDDASSKNNPSNDNPGSLDDDEDEGMFGLLLKDDDETSVGSAKNKNRSNTPQQSVLKPTEIKSEPKDRDRKRSFDIMSLLNCEDSLDFTAASTSGPVEGRETTLNTPTNEEATTPTLTPASKAVIADDAEADDSICKIKEAVSLAPPSKKPRLETADSEDCAVSRPASADQGKDSVESTSMETSEVEGKVTQGSTKTAPMDVVREGFQEAALSNDRNDAEKKSQDGSEKKSQDGSEKKIPGWFREKIPGRFREKI